MSKAAAILISRQGLRPSLRKPWVISLKKAVSFVKERGYILYTSVDSPNWEIITACASLEDMPLQIILPLTDAGTSGSIVKEVFKEFNLNQDITQFRHLPANCGKQMRKAMWKTRDSDIVDAADILMPVSIRAGGHLASLLQVAAAKGKSIKEDFSVQYEENKNPLAYSIDENELSDTIRKVGQQYIIHWTRSTNEPWPNERKIDFYEALLISQDYPRTAFHTLKNIILTEKIVASSKNMPGKVATVSFSALDPARTIPLMRWRARHRQMSFEPYGVGIENATALSLGIKEVVYHEPEKEHQGSNVEKWLRQSIGKITDWRSEKEYRIKGDLDLSAVPRSKLILICDRKEEAEQLESETGIESVWFRE